MATIPPHTHTFSIPTATTAEIEAGVESGKAITPDQLKPVIDGVVTATATAVAAAANASADADEISDQLDDIATGQVKVTAQVGGATQSAEIGFDNTRPIRVELDGVLQGPETLSHVGTVISSIDGSWWHGTLVVTVGLTIGVSDREIWPTHRMGADFAGGDADLAALDDLIEEQENSLPSIQRWAYGTIDAASLIPGPDTVDPAEYVQRIVAAGLPKGKVLKFGSQRAWDFQTRPSNPYFPLGSDADIGLEWDRAFEFGDYAVSTSPSFFHAECTFGPELAVTGGDIVKGTTRTVTLPEGHGLVRNDEVSVYATAGLSSLTDGAFTLLEDIDYVAKAEEKTVQSSTATTVTFFETFEDNYPATCTPKLKKFLSRPKLRLINPMANGPGRDVDSGENVNSDRFLELVGGHIDVEGGQINNFGGMFARLTGCGGTIRDLNGNLSDRIASAGGFLHIAQGCTDLKVQNVVTRGGGQVFMTTTGAAYKGITRRTVFEDCIPINCRDGFTQHNAETDTTYKNCSVINASGNAFDIRARNTHVLGGTVERAGTAALIFRWAANGLLVDGLTVRTALTGIRQNSGSSAADYDPGDITIRNTRQYDIGGSGSLGAISAVYADLRTGSPPTLGKLTMTGNYAEITGTAVAFSVAGKWDRPIVANNEAGGTGTGVAYYFHDAGNGAGDGPISGTFTGNKQSTTYAAPVITNTTGVWTVERNSVTGGSLPQQASGTTIYASYLSDIIVITGNTTIGFMSSPALFEGKKQTLLFTGTPTITHTAAATVGAFKLAAGTDFSATAALSLTVVSNGVQWVQV